MKVYISIPISGRPLGKATEHAVWLYRLEMAAKVFLKLILKEQFADLFL